MSEPLKRLAFISDDRAEAVAARDRLAARYGEVPEEQADVIVALGGDGFMLETLHRNLPGAAKPIYGMNRGSVGFMMNDYGEDSLIERINAAEQGVIHPLVMHAVCRDGQEQRAVAINEVSLLRQTHQTAKLRLSSQFTLDLRTEVFAEDFKIQDTRLENLEADFRFFLTRNVELGYLFHMNESLTDTPNRFPRTHSFTLRLSFNY